ncbi:MAG: hypothetical protein MASP_01892 [Candidatus Methanolliviera sp. GoM_asphalt]|nr:MAG: hypothetical protein MASP_01892 [Candidatus Methanolliviera sp. GoM_asphalt]
MKKMMGFLGLVLVLSVLAVSMAMPAMADDQARALKTIHIVEIPPRSSAHAEISGSQMEGFLRSIGGVVRVVIKSSDQTLYDEVFRYEHAVFIKIPGEKLITIDVLNYDLDPVKVKYSISVDGEEVYLEI